MLELNECLAHEIPADGKIKVAIFYNCIIQVILQADFMEGKRAGRSLIISLAGNRIVVFYGSNSWAYTRLGRITGRTTAEMADLLGNGNVTITISYGGQ